MVAVCSGVYDSMHEHYKRSTCREFLSEVLREGFSPERGLFTQSLHTGELCPNPLAMHIYPDTWYDHYYLLGRLLGKVSAFCYILHHKQ